MFKISIKIFSVIVVAVIFFSQCKNNSYKIGVIEMDKLVYEFDGMKEATKDYTQKMNKWQANSDTLKNKLNQLIYNIKLDSINNDLKKSQIDKQKFILLRQQFYTLQQTIEEKAKEEDKKMTSAVMAQINEYIEKYGKDKNYDLIITNTQLKNVGYVKESLDITNEVLLYANMHYNGK